jgi:hypothetical protein
MVLAIQASGDGALVDRTFDHIRGLEGGWAALSGDVVATGAAGDTVALTMRAGGPMAHLVIGDGWKWLTWFTMVVGIAAVLVVASVLIIRQRRDTS